MTGQDWETAGWTKPKASASKDAPSTKPVGKAGRRDAVIAAATDAVRLEKVSLSTSRAIAQARAVKGLTQAQLARLVNVPQRTVNEFESGKAQPDNAVLQKLARALGTRLSNPKKSKKAPKTAAGA